MDYMSEEIKQTLMSTFEIAMLSAARDAFGFGEKRLVKLLWQFDKLTSYMANGWVYWFDLIDELKNECHIKLAIKDGAEHLVNYRRPDPEDMYTEADFVDQKDWEEVLRFLRLKDNGVRVHDESSLFWLGYKNPYDKIQLYDFLSEIEYAVRFLHAARPGDEFKGTGIRNNRKPEPAPAAKQERKKRKKGKRA